jgi:hypothetical protein
MSYTQGLERSSSPRGTTVVRPRLPALGYSPSQTPFPLETAQPRPRAPHAVATRNPKAPGSALGARSETGIVGRLGWNGRPCHLVPYLSGRSPAGQARAKWPLRCRAFVQSPRRAAGFFTSARTSGERRDPVPAGKRASGPMLGAQPEEPASEWRHPRTCSISDLRSASDSSIDWRGPRIGHHWIRPGPKRRW